MREAIREAERAGVRLVPRPPDDVLSIIKVQVFRQSYYPFNRDRLIEWLASFGEAESPWGCGERSVVPEPPDALACWLADLAWFAHWDEEALPNLATLPRALPKPERDMRKMLWEWLESWGGNPQPP